MKLYGIQTLLTEASQHELLEFFSQCPFTIQVPLFLELGVTTDPNIELKPDGQYSMIPLRIAAGHNHRTDNGALFWEPKFFGEDTSARMEELPYVISSVNNQRGSIVLSNGVYALGRRIRGYLNSKEEQQYAALQRRSPLVLTFEGETIVEYAVPDYLTSA